jgi:hypothetical protein
MISSQSSIWNLILQSLLLVQFLLPTIAAASFAFSHSESYRTVSLHGQRTDSRNVGGTFMILSSDVTPFTITRLPNLTEMMCLLNANEQRSQQNI